ncbi:MAG: hypothetical protein H2056_01535 [Sphingopyxis sp.]|nr:hypothetical protein [Sphingopyxis sp.]
MIGFLNVERHGRIAILTMARPESRNAIAIAERIVCKPPRALRLTKRLLREAQHSRLSDILELSAAYQAIVHDTAGNRKAIDALIAKRPPVFTGD